MKNKLLKEDIIGKIIKDLDIQNTDASTIVEKAIQGGETKINDIDSWYAERFRPNIINIDTEGYTKMCVDALKILNSTAATDYGTSRQRDLGQLWGDMTRGYLGEYAFQIFLKNKFNIESELDHTQGELKNYLSLDVHKIRKNDEEFRAPNIKIGIKTTKLNGIWLDITGQQFFHSDIHVFVKIGASRDHLFAFFKSLSVFKDKVLPKGIQAGSITVEEADELYNSLPSFSNIPAYICGFVDSRYQYEELSYEGIKKTKNYTITGWNGPYFPDNINKIKQIECPNGSVKFEGIGEFSNGQRYLFNTGKLKWKNDSWQEIINSI